MLQVFVPEMKQADEFSLDQTALGRMFYIAVTLLLGWPMYLVANVSGRPYDSKWVSHFDPYAPVFSKRERAEVHFFYLLSACQPCHTAHCSITDICYGRLLSIVGCACLAAPEVYVSAGLIDRLSSFIHSSMICLL